MRVDGSRIWKEKVADSKISGYVCTGPGFDLPCTNHCTSALLLKSHCFNVTCLVSIYQYLLKRHFYYTK